MSTECLWPILQKFVIIIAIDLLKEFLYHKLSSPTLRPLITYQFSVYVSFEITYFMHIWKVQRSFNQRKPIRERTSQSHKLRIDERVESEIYIFLILKPDIWIQSAHTLKIYNGWRWWSSVLCRSWRVSRLKTWVFRQPKNETGRRVWSGHPLIHSRVVKLVGFLFYFIFMMSKSHGTYPRVNSSVFWFQICSYSTFSMVTYAACQLTLRALTHEKQNLFFCLVLGCYYYYVYLFTHILSWVLFVGVFVTDCEWSKCEVNFYNKINQIANLQNDA